MDLFIFDETLWCRWGFCLCMSAAHFQATRLYIKPKCRLSFKIGPVTAQNTENTL